MKLLEMVTDAVEWVWVDSGSRMSLLPFHVYGHTAFVAPTGFLFTGEFRPPKVGEWLLNQKLKPILAEYDWGKSGARWILLPKSQVPNPSNYICFGEELCGKTYHGGCPVHERPRQVESEPPATHHFNQLTEAQAERLAKLAEEASEVIKAITKILRHGYASQSNLSDLEREIVDFRNATFMMCRAGDISSERMAAMGDDIPEDKQQYFHHQPKEIFQNEIRVPDTLHSKA